MIETRVTHPAADYDSPLAPCLTATLRELVVTKWERDDARRERDVFRDWSIVLMGETHRQAGTIRRQSAIIREHLNGRPNRGDWSDE